MSEGEPVSLRMWPPDQSPMFQGMTTHPGVYAQCKLDSGLLIKKIGHEIGYSMKMSLGGIGDKYDQNYFA